ncbi:hypothetical protein PIB30_010795 [Stylosanthes scabra]|uniref:Phosphoglycerate mutase-like protein 1 n=1 Tax=Stylosanthes scabra TaxID=79078 RepID=A0ABU6Z2B6_9FABA|nr:hypothetical protein [Stylosanthes scabra]
MPIIITHDPILLNSAFVPVPISQHRRAIFPPSQSQRSPPRILRFSPRSDMDAAAGQGLYPLHRCKTLHLVRHAQGFHNVEGDKNPDAYLSYDLFDANLTPLGWSQVDNLRNHVKTSDISKGIELVIVSPLLRTMQTAVGVFGGEAYTDGITAPPLMNDNGVHPCDKRRSITEYRNMFPAIDFSLIESDEDILWKPDIRETNEEVVARGLKFFEWLWTRKEKEIALVSHSGFLFHALSSFGNDCHPTIKSEICTHYANCELRSVVIIDRGMIGSDNPTTNYPGKIPAGLDLPSDIADEKLSGNRQAN